MATTTKGTVNQTRTARTVKVTAPPAEKPAPRTKAKAAATPTKATAKTANAKTTTKATANQKTAKAPAKEADPTKPRRKMRESTFSVYACQASGVVVEHTRAFVAKAPALKAFDNYVDWWIEGNLGPTNEIMLCEDFGQSADDFIILATTNPNYQGTWEEDGTFKWNADRKKRSDARHAALVKSAAARAKTRERQAAASAKAKTQTATKPARTKAQAA